MSKLYQSYYHFNQWQDIIDNVFTGVSPTTQMITPSSTMELLEAKWLPSSSPLPSFSSTTNIVTLPGPIAPRYRALIPTWILTDPVSADLTMYGHDLDL